MGPSASKSVRSVLPAPDGHWVGDGFPVRTLFAYDDPELMAQLSPFLLLDYAGPAEFPPSTVPRGVGPHPHRGFETVTVVFEGDLEHRDSAGNHGRIGQGDVQWMTAGGGVLHEEKHSREFAARGGRLEMIQLWVNLPAASKMTPARYQTILDRDIPVASLTGEHGQQAGTVRVIAGAFGKSGGKGPARTFTPIELWDVQLRGGSGPVSLPLTEGHNAALFVRRGALDLGGKAPVEAAQLAVLDPRGDSVLVRAAAEARFVVLAGAPIPEPVVGHGPFVMNTRAEIVQAITDFQAGKMGRWPE
jgi:redox-sensitive bicupin YhaK (pirin superfamily)